MVGEDSILSFARPKWRLSKTAAEKLQRCARAIARRAPLMLRGRRHVVHEDGRLLLVLRARAARGGGEEPQEAA